MQSLQARVKVEGEITVLIFTGRIDIESAPPFRQACRTQLQGKKMVFDFTHMSFVGSTGLLPFLEALEEFTKNPANSAKFCGVGIEMGRVLSATTLGLIEVWETEAQAIEAYRNPRMIEQALANRALPATVRVAAAGISQEVSLVGDVAAPLKVPAEPKNFGLLSLSYEAEDSKSSDAELLEE